MPYRLYASGAFACALALLGFTGQADATTRLMFKASPSLTILAQNEENEEVQDLLDPQSDSGTPVAPPNPRQATSQEPVKECRPSLKATATARRTRSTRKRASSPSR